MKIDLISGFDRFDELLEEYIFVCAQKELDTKGYLDPPGGTLWAQEYMPEFLERLPTDIFKDVDLHEDFIQDEAEERFVWMFRNFWDTARTELG